MQMINKREELERFDFLPLSCDQCGFQTTIPLPDGEVLDELYDISCLRESQHELVVLQRAQALFDRFPDSRHSQKMCKEFLGKDECPTVEADPEFDAALNADPELKAFLGGRLFWLPARLKAVTESIERQGQPDSHLIGCTNCQNGHFGIEPKFFQNPR
ncbi:hypothetical protein IAD21_00831 [Abditibacteriota bacterium]|nr:hypothetical protein IAD21_00831 [Abditibacteriota bacterium]